MDEAYSGVRWSGSHGEWEYGGAMPLTGAVRTAKRAPLLQMVKTALATILAWIVAGALIPDGPAPVFAAIAAMLVVQPSLNQSLTKGVERSVGVIAGVVLASALALAFGSATWVVLIATAAALALAWGLRMTMGSANQVAISALLVLAIGAGTVDYALARILETFIGAIIGIVVHLALVPPVALVPARRALDNFGEEIARSLERLSADLSHPRSPKQLEALMIDTRRPHRVREETYEALSEAEDSLALNPRGRRHRDEVAGLRQTVDIFALIATQVLGMARAYVDQYDEGVHSELAVRGIAEELRRAAHDTRRQVRLTLAEPSSPYVEEAPALTAPLTLGAPSGMRWILIGSLMEDLRRIREELGART
ncbi:MAG TPA: FUSC family protein [Nocardioides sp.]